MVEKVWQCRQRVPPRSDCRRAVRVMQEYGSTATEVSGNGSQHRGGRRSSGPVASPCCPEYGAESESGRRYEGACRQYTIRRPVPPWRRSASRDDGIPAPGQVVEGRAGTTHQKATMVMTVQSDLMSGIPDLAHDVWCSPGHPTEHEERGMYTPAFEQAQEVRCGQRVRTVVEGQRHMVGRADAGQLWEQLATKQRHRGDGRQGVGQRRRRSGCCRQSDAPVNDVALARACPQWSAPTALCRETSS